MSERLKTFLEVGVGANDFIPLPTPVVGVDGKTTPIDFETEYQYVGIDMPLVVSRSYRGFHEWFHGGNADVDIEARQEPDLIADVMAGTRGKLAHYRPGARATFMVADGEKLPLPDDSVDEVYMSNVMGSLITDEYTESLLRETRRVIGEAGRLVIRENITPQWVADNIDELIHRAGFPAGLTTFVPKDEYYKQMQIKYGLTWADFEPDQITGEHFFGVAEIGDDNG